jgi:hypothetical protein
MGILALEWLDESLDIIPDTLAHSYWVWNMEDIVRLEPYERLLLLVRIVDEAVPETEAEIALWKALKLARFIQTGELPLRGETPRLLLCACLERSPEHHNVVDRQFYLKIREHGGFTGTAASFEEIYDELLLPLPATAPKTPKAGDSIAIRHPASDDWVDANCVSCKNGRIVTKYRTDVIQLPLRGVYWDARTGWSEARSRAAPPRPRARARAESDFFMTGCETTKEPPVQEATPKIQFPVLAEPRHRDTRKLLQGGIKMMSTSKFIDRTVPPPVTDTFKGVSLPVKPFRATIARSAPTRRPIQFVQDVVNVTFGVDLGQGRRLRKFNVRIENALTNKSTYQWVAEDEVAPEDVEKLVHMYKLHIESRVTVIPSL